LVKHTKYLVMT